MYVSSSLLGACALCSEPNTASTWDCEVLQMRNPLVQTKIKRVG